jgi:hypothetical protein
MESIDFVSVGLRVSSRRCRCGAPMLEVSANVECCANKNTPHAWKGTSGLDGAARQLAIVLRDTMVRDAAGKRR